MKLIKLIYFFTIILFFENCKTKSNQLDKIPNETKFVFAIDGLRLRESPDIKSKSLATIPYSSEIEIIRKTGIGLKLENNLSGDFVETKWKNKTGFLFDGYLLDKKEFISFDKALIFVKNKFLSKIKDENFASNYRITDYWSKDWKWSNVRFGQKKSNSKYKIYTFIPTKSEEGCSFYNDSNCINVILNDKDEIIFTDLDYESMGMVNYNDEEIIKFGFLGGEGDGCNSFTGGSTFVYIFNSKTFVKNQWGGGQSCLSKDCSVGVEVCKNWGPTSKNENFFDSQNNPIQPTSKIKEYFLRGISETR